MSEQEPPSWVGTPAAMPPPVPPSDDGRWPRSAVISVAALGGFLALLLVGWLAFAIGRSTGRSDETATNAPITTAPPTTAAPTTEVAPAPTTTEVAPTTTAPPTTTTTTTTPPTTTTTTTAPPTTTTTTEAEAGAGSLDAAETPVRSAVFKGGKVYLRGELPSQELADVIVAKAAAVVGPDNVVVEYEINPDAPLPSSAPLYVEDLVLFAYNSVVINPDFVPLLGLGLVLLEQNPNVTITVVGHTDAIGSEEYNLTLAQRRIEAVIGFWTSQGVDPARLSGIARGEASPIADNETPEGQQLNRRAEFIIYGILE